MRQERKKYYNRNGREVWYIGQRTTTKEPQRVTGRMGRFSWPDRFASEGCAFVTVYAFGRWVTIEVPFTDLEIRSEGKRYDYMLFPAGEK